MVIQICIVTLFVVTSFEVTFSKICMYAIFTDHQIIIKKILRITTNHYVQKLLDKNMSLGVFLTSMTYKRRQSKQFPESLNIK